MNDYSYLKTFITPQSQETNWFVPIKEEQVKASEERLNYSFPSQLKDFYQEIGCGFFKKKINSEEIEREFVNRILSPQTIADIVLEGPKSGQIVPDIEFGEDEMPFFEIADGASFLVMRPQSDKPNAVYTMAGNLVEENFEKFVWRLYHESPRFYLNY